jgi:DNA-binding NarL/FixJ family response regulator
MTRILIADDHEMVRRGLRDVLEGHPDWTICGEAVTGLEAVAKTRDLRPDVVVLDFSMPELNGLEVTRQIRQTSPQTQILMLTMHESEQLAREVLIAGARGFVLKSDAGKVLVDAIEHLSRHKPFFTAKVSEVLLNELNNPTVARMGSGELGGPLTPRERQIVQLIAEGRSTKEVADRLNISVKTADTHRANLMRKLNLHSVSELVRYAIRNRIVEA